MRLQSTTPTSITTDEAQWITISVVIVLLVAMLIVSVLGLREIEAVSGGRHLNWRERRLRNAILRTKLINLWDDPEHYHSQAASEVRTVWPELAAALDALVRTAHKGDLDPRTLDELSDETRQPPSN
jgi:hypothetical protein